LGSDDALGVGKLIGNKFRVSGTLGSGGMGIVLEATDIELGRKVAIKVLLPIANAIPGTAERFLREAKAAAALQNLHAVKIHQIGGLEDGPAFIVMEHLVGRDLEAELRARRSLPVEEAVGHVLQACEAIAEAHALGIVHRDLKPANLFLVDNLSGSGLPGIKVLDFGVAKLTEDAVGSSLRLTSSQEVLGTPLYMAPEQRRGDADVDGRADIWALGVILYELTSGTVPFSGTTRAELDDKVMRAEPLPLHDRSSHIPLELSRVVMRCLEKDPAARFEDVARFAADLVPFGPPSSDEGAVRIARARGVPLSIRPQEAVIPVSSPAAGLATTEPARVPSLAPPARERLLGSTAPPLAAAELGTADMLVSAMASRERVTFLVGSALTWPHQERRGVPSVNGIIKLIRTELEGKARDLAGLERHLQGRENPYQAAFEYLQKVRGQAHANRIIRRSVLQARLPDARVPPGRVEQDGDENECMSLENDLGGWSLSPGVEALGRLVRDFSAQFGRTVLTSNFDPLIQVATRRAGGYAYALALDDDGGLRNIIGPGCRVVHFHGYWFGSDTLHTPTQLARERRKLQASLKKLLTETKHTLVVLAYSGWDDIFTRSLIDVVQEGTDNFDVLWAFYDSEPEKIEKTSARLLSRLEPGLIRGRVQLYAGIDVHKLLPALYDELCRRSTAPPEPLPTPGPEPDRKPEVGPAPKPEPAPRPAIDAKPDPEVGPKPRSDPKPTISEAPADHRHIYYALAATLVASMSVIVIVFRVGLGFGSSTPTGDDAGVQTTPTLTTITTTTTTTSVPVIIPAPATTFRVSVDLDGPVSCPPTATVELGPGIKKKELNSQCHADIDGIPIALKGKKVTLKLDRACADVSLKPPLDQKDVILDDAPIRVNVQPRSRCVCVLGGVVSSSVRSCPDCYTQEGCR
jgi:hypothetical protein